MKKTFLFIFTFPLFVFSQHKEIKKADTAFALEHYVESIRLFEKLVDEGVDSPNVYEKLGDANYFNANYVQAYKWYLKLSGLNYQMDGEHQYRYAQTLKSVGLNEDSKKEMESFGKKYPNEIRTNQYKKGLNDNTKMLFSNVASLAFNSKYSDYGTAIKGDTLIFASSRNFVLDNTSYARTNQAFTSLYHTVKLASGEFSTPKIFSKSSFSVYHEATAVFTKDGKTMYYSQNQLSKKSKSKLVNGLFKIYKSVSVNGKWKNEGAITFSKNDSVRIADPALSPDGKYLYFAADFKESFGKSDLFKVAIHSDGTFGEVEHLSNKINTEGRECFPFITEDNTLIFASDGYPGFGGLDLYALDLSDPNAVVTNLGVSINSPFDDFALTINTAMNQGYFSSNRPGAKGDDDIYSFDLTYLPISMSGIVVDEITNEIIPNAIVIVLDEKGNTIATLRSDTEGKFSLNNLKRDSKYTLKIQQLDNSVVEKKIVTYKSDVNEILAIKKVVPQHEIDLNKLLVSNIIYFNTDKSFIRKDATVELDKVAAVMKQYPQIKVEIASYTDSRESEKYNLILSQNRANRTLEYLVSKGIDRMRLTAKGFGETQLVNNCKNGVKCGNAEHQLNRRSVFIVHIN